MSKEILNNKEIERAIKRIAFEVIEKNKGTENFYLIGGTERRTFACKTAWAEKQRLLSTIPLDTQQILTSHLKDFSNINLL